MWLIRKSPFQGYKPWNKFWYLFKSENDAHSYLCCMFTNPFPFNVLFCFENELQIIIEIKRTDIQSEDKSLVYKWLKITKTPIEIQQLSFRSMDDSGENQTRTFAEGMLKWNPDFALFNDEKMLSVQAEHVNMQWLELIADFLI